MASDRGDKVTGSGRRWRFLIFAFHSLVLGLAFSGLCEAARPLSADEGALTDGSLAQRAGSLAAVRATRLLLQSNGEYTVAVGDTLSGIATKFNTTQAELQTLNPSITDPNQIMAGQVLQVPQSNAAQPPSTPAAAPPSNPVPAPSGGQYTVKSGDNLSEIAAMFGTTTAELQTLNPSITNPDNISVGQVLQLPQSNAGPPSGETPAPSPTGTPYTVMTNETLTDIARRFGTTVEAILAINPTITNPNNIFPAQQILIPPPTPPPPPATTSPPPVQGQGTQYTVIGGDTLDSIASKFGTTTPALLAANPSITDQNKINPGQVITIPQSAASPPSSGSSTNTGAIVGGVVGGVVGASAIVGIFLFSYCRHRNKAATLPPPRSDNWESSDGAPNPFQDLGPESGSNTGVDVLFRNPRLTSAKRSTKSQPPDSKMPLMGADSEEGITSVAMDDSAMVAEDISALDAAVGRKVDMAAMGSGNSTRPIVHLESGGGTRTAHFVGDESPSKKDMERRSDLADTWQISSEMLQCRMRDGEPVRLGKGGNGSVYLGLLLGNTDVAIKVVERPTAKEQQRFEREIDLLRACFHPNVIRFLGANIRPEKTFLVMEFCPGGDLYNAIQNDDEGQFRWGKRGLSIALDIARGLTYLHSRSIIHLDVKSPNILLTKGLEAKVSDIGLGKVMAAGGSGTGPAGASYWWSAPEQLFGYACTSASDVFSFGVVLWELCTGEAPVDRHLREIRVPEEAPQEIVDLITACRNPEPTMRPTSVEVHATIRRQTY